ncbi:MAG: hypothetical protein WEK74_09600 [Hydrogenophaga sp.]
MFEFGVHQASGFQAAGRIEPAVVMPVATTSRPGQAYEVLCAVATQLGAIGLDVVIIDGSAQEVTSPGQRDGRHLGLIRALEDPSIGGLGAAGPTGEWLVMPGSLGLQALMLTARAAGPGMVVSRLLAPFASGTVVLLYAPAAQLAALLAGLQVPVMVPVSNMAQATLDAYGSVKALHAGGLSPVLAPMDMAVDSAQAPLGQVVRSVCDCAERYLSHPLPQWDISEWGQKVRAAAFAAPWPAEVLAGQPLPQPLDAIGTTAAFSNRSN